MKTLFIPLKLTHPWNPAGRRGYTLNEFLVLSAVLLTIVGLAVPGFLREQACARNEIAAIARLRSIALAQASYAKSCGAGGYATAFAAPGDTALLQHAVLRTHHHRAATSIHDGYRFTLHPAAGASAGPGDCNGMPTRSAFVVSAEPVRFRKTGKRSFAVTNRKLVWQVESSAAPVEPFASPATLVD
jgi:type II secretory pathway pseudopilin PulG